MQDFTLIGYLNKKQASVINHRSAISFDPENRDLVATFYSSTLINILQISYIYIYIYEIHKVQKNILFLCEIIHIPD